MPKSAERPIAVEPESQSTSAPNASVSSIVASASLIERPLWPGATLNFSRLAPYRSGLQYP
jgi:hypothetical protein